MSSTIEERDSIAVVSVPVAAAIINLQNELRKQFGSDFAFTVMGNGQVLAANNLRLGIVNPRTAEPVATKGGDV